jgi:hypothetical protein
VKIHHCSYRDPARPVQKTFMFQLLRTCSIALLTLFIMGRQAGAQTNRLALTGTGAKGLTAVATNGCVILSWPVMAGTWQLMEQQPAFTAEWVPVAAEHYLTNAFGVSVMLALPAKTALYRLRHSPGIHPPKLSATPDMPPMPPLPPPSTNRPKPFKSSGQP